MSKKTITKKAKEASVVTKVEDKKVAVKKVEAKIAHPKKVAVKAATKKAEPKKVAELKKVDSKAVVKKAETKKVEAKKVEPKKVEEKTPVKKAAVTVAAKEEQKKIAVKKAPEKIAAKPEPKKITTAKALEKIAAKPEPKKIAEKKVEAKEVKKAEIKKPAKVVAPKKEAVKKAVKSVKKAVNSDKANKFEALSVEECIQLMRAMNVQYAYEDYYTLLLDEPNLNVLEKNIIEGNKINEMNLNFDEVGYDADLVMVTLNKIAATMEIKALDYKELKQGINNAIKFKLNKDGEVNAAQYLEEFKISEKLLMIGQRKGANSTSDITALIGGNVTKFYQHFFDFAYELLPEWQYNDVKFYEDFAYAVLSQFADIYESDQLRVQMDVADLYIKHGDYQQGDDMYGYILRDNQIKDYIYYRYASIYKDIDFNKARSIAYSSLQSVDDRYTYYTEIMAIINN